VSQTADPITPKSLAHPLQLPAYTAKSVWEKGQQFFVDGQGQRLPSVSTILNATRPIAQREALANWRQRVGDAEASRISSTASRRGTGTHRYIQQYLQGETKVCSDAVRPYWESFAPVIQKLHQVQLVEGYVFHGDVGYAGRIDCVASYQDVACLCEWKTADRPKGSHDRLYDYPLQLAAYCGALNHTYMDQGVQISSALLAIGIPGQEAEQFWFDASTLATLWGQWQQRVEEYYQRINRFRSS